MDTQERKPLIAEKFTRASFLLWVMLLPQVVLAIINVSYYTLIRGEVTITQAGLWTDVFIFEGGLIAIGLALMAFFASAKRCLGLIACVFLFLLNIGYLFFVTYYIEDFVPDTVDMWIFPVGAFIYCQFSLVMPVIFYTGLRIACMPLPISKTADISVSIGVSLIIPLFGYTMMFVLAELMAGIGIPDVVMVGAFIGVTAIMMFAILRLLTYIYVVLKDGKNGQLALAAIVGLVFPLAGLSLNISIPFPVDFQSVWVYVMAIINGIILMISFKEGSKLNTLSWCCRCLMYPFSLYFFLVFLPFMPLSLPAIIAVGSGFLILAPTVLFIIHTRKLIDEGKCVVASHGFVTAAILFVVMFAVIPSLMTAGAFSDKAALTRAIDAAYNPDYTSAADIDAKQIERTLIKLKQMKEGIFLPFISPAYNKIVFNGMVLPDYKIEEMYKMFVGQEMPERKFDGNFSFRARPRIDSRWANPIPDRNVEISNIKVDSLRNGEFVKATVQLTLDNRGGRNSEFVTDIEPGPGVMVCGYRLRMNGEDAEGLVFEKKAAMWVYHMIRDFSNRDPGLLVYKSDNVLKLSVYPFAAGEQRVTAIDFIYPAAVKPDIRIGDKPISFSDQSEDAKAVSIATADSGKFIILTGNRLAKLPAVGRKPYIHFIVDCSVAADKEFGRFSKMMFDLAGQSGIDTCKITLANFKSYSITDKPIGAGNIEQTMQGAVKPVFEGGLCYERAIIGELLKYEKASDEDLSVKLSVPVFVVIKAAVSKTVPAGDMSVFGLITPDVPRYYIANSSAAFDAVAFAGKTSQEFDALPKPEDVVILKGDDCVEVCLKNAGTGILHFNSPAAVPQIYQPDNGTFQPFEDVVNLGGEELYAKGLSLWNRYRQTACKPYTIDEATPGLVQDSKACGILIPYTSYIVLENSAQLEILKRKERQRLNSNNALEFDEFMESPAPPVLLLLPFVFAMLFFKKRLAK